MKIILNEDNQMHYFISSSGSGTVISYGSGSDFLTSYGSGSSSTSQKVTVPTVPVPQHCGKGTSVFYSGSAKTVSKNYFDNCRYVSLGNGYLVRDAYLVVNTFLQ
jgi:hypothetical protein